MIFLRLSHKADHDVSVLSFAVIFLLLLITNHVDGQKVSTEAIRARIEAYKKDPRGPYKDIRWFCPDSTTLPPAERCPTPGGVQRARMKDDAIELAKANHLFFGQILSTTDKAEFWDDDNNHSRIKQYQLGKYLQSIDDGWVLRRAQYYRGAFQAEDEQAWGIDFFKWLLADDAILNSRFFLIRQSLRDIPHRGDDGLTLSIRAVSRTLGDSIPAFMDLRVKIHGQPEPADLQKVIAFRNAHKPELTSDQMSAFDELISGMKSLYDTNDLLQLCPFLDALPPGQDLKAPLTTLIEEYGTLTNPMQRSMTLAEHIMLIREKIRSVKDPAAKLSLLDISLRLEDLFITEMAAWHAATLSDALDKICYAGLASAGAGFIEGWEWDEIKSTLTEKRENEIPLGRLQEVFMTAQRALEWGTGMVRANYGDIISLYMPFEPLAREFSDDRIRSSALLSLGESVSELGRVIAEEDQISNNVMGITDHGSMRGLNPGYAKGQLAVITGSTEHIDMVPEKIYVFEKAPSDLKPVAGIATVTEGNLVSHIQLLARNLGIPNAVVSQQDLNALKPYAGTEVFYAVSFSGHVLMKKADQMSSAERELFVVKTRSQEKITVPVDKIDLHESRILDLRTVNASQSGTICGPKAANLGQLKALFPEQVVEGIVIPFGIFKEHMDQKMPGHDMSYWLFLQNTFKKAEAMKSAGQTQTEVDRFTLAQLKVLQNAIKSIPLSGAFIADLNAAFSKVLGADIGTLPVFLRSDTNMEDLKDFTGAGLNLTVFNVVEKDKILQGIRDVWASPYTERSFTWRQRYLLNPEYVFPSILIIPSVDVECSGVMITTGVQTGRSDDITIAFNHGVAGAVDGQAAETYALESNGQHVLLSPAREPSYRRLPATGGTESFQTTFEQPILSAQKIAMLRATSAEITRKLPGSPGMESMGPFDIELGFKDGKIWLFQVRPFVENKNAISSAYLESISPKIPENVNIKLNRKR